MAKSDHPSADWYPFKNATGRRKADGATIEAVSRVLPDWDGKNWAAVRAALRAIGRTPAEISAMSELDIRMTFAISHKPMIRLFEGAPRTHTPAVITEIRGVDIRQEGTPALKTRANSPGPTAPRLGTRERDALRIIREKGPILAKDLAAALKVTAEVVRAMVHDRLRFHGVVNHRDGRGYRFEEPGT